MAKQEACAAASNSSGEVDPSCASERRGQLTGSVPIAPLSNEVMAPEPSRSEPFQVAVAVRVVMINPP
jgi:hypothetical protein